MGFTIEPASFLLQLPMLNIEMGEGGCKNELF